MATEPSTVGNRGPWIIAGAILAGTILVVGFLWWNSGAECRNWQKEAADRAHRVQDASRGVDQDEKTEAGEALIEIANDQPHGCPDPEI